MAQQIASLLNKVATLGVAVGVGGVAVQNCLFDVDGGQRAVIFDRFRGVLQTCVGEGTHFLIPWVQTPIVMDIRSKPRVISSVTGTKDLQNVNISLRVLSRPDELNLPKIYQTLGTDFDDRVLPSVGNEVLKAVVAQYNADQLLTQREKVSRQIREELTARAETFNLTLDDVAITHLTFGQDFAQAIEAKQVAYQEAERSKFIVMKAEQEKKAAIIRAEGESEAAKLVSDALNEAGLGYIEVQRIDAAKEIAETLARSRNITYIPNSEGNNLLLGLSGQISGSYIMQCGSLTENEGN